MAQAKTDNRTPAPVDSSRRGFLDQAVAVAAGGAAVGLALPVPVGFLKQSLCLSDLRVPSKIAQTFPC